MTRRNFLLALDQGTSSSRSIVFDPEGRVVGMAQREFRQLYPEPGWVEHDPIEIRDSYAIVPQKPGLGVELDDEACKKYKA